MSGAMALGVVFQQPPQLEAVELAYFLPDDAPAAYHTRLVERQLFDMQSSRESKIDVRFLVEVLASIWLIESRCNQKLLQEGWFRGVTWQR